MSLKILQRKSKKDFMKVLRQIIQRNNKKSKKSKKSQLYSKRTRKLFR